MKGKGRSRQAILAAVTVLAAAQAGTAYASTGPASESGVQTGAWIQEGQDWKYQGTDGTLKTGWVKTENGWYYLDLWNLVSEEEFTNSAIHLSPAGEEILALEIIESGIIQSLGSK